MKLSDLKPHLGNPRKITDQGLHMLSKSVNAFGPLDGFLFNEVTERLNGGHQRQKVIPGDAEVIITETYATPTEKGTTKIGYVLYQGERHPYRQVRWSAETETAAIIAANQQGGEFDLPLLADRFSELDALNIDMDLTGFTKSEIEDICAPFRGMPDGETKTPAEARASLAERFLIPPFSVLNAREGTWQQRKRDWLALGIKSEIGRGGHDLDHRYGRDQDTTLGALPPNERAILKRTGKYA